MLCFKPPLLDLFRSQVNKFPDFILTPLRWFVLEVFDFCGAFLVWICSNFSLNRKVNDLLFYLSFTVFCIVYFCFLCVSSNRIIRRTFAAILHSLCDHCKPSDRSPSEWPCSFLLSFCLKNIPTLSSKSVQVVENYSLLVKLLKVRWCFCWLPCDCLCYNMLHVCGAGRVRVCDHVCECASMSVCECKCEHQSV